MIVLPADLHPLNTQIIRLAQLDIPILEDPIGSNRSPEIDAMCVEFGVPLGSYWCALWASKIWRAAGAAIPPVNDAKGWHPAKAETWHAWAVEEGLFSRTPVLGAAALYDFTGAGKSADHIGVALASITPILMDFEGNTSQAGVSRNGELATLKPVDTKHLLGYVLPRAA